jgi:hypothetical protein
MSAHYVIGTHTLEVREDIQIFRLNGECTEADLRALIPIGDEVIARYGYLISITDARRSTGITPEARRFNAEWVRDHPERLAVSIVFGASLPARVLIKLLVRAVQLISKRSEPILMVESEKDAFALAEVERKRLLAEALRRGFTPSR